MEEGGYMSKYYFGTDIMDVMFNERLLIRRRKLNIDEVWDRLVCGEAIMCFDDIYDELVMSIGKKLRLPIGMTNKVREIHLYPRDILIVMKVEVAKKLIFEENTKSLESELCEDLFIEYAIF